MAVIFFIIWRGRHIVPIKMCKISIIFLWYGGRHIFKWNENRFFNPRLFYDIPHIINVNVKYHERTLVICVSSNSMINSF